MPDCNNFISNPLHKQKIAPANLYSPDHFFALIGLRTSVLRLFLPYPAENCFFMLTLGEITAFLRHEKLPLFSTVLPKRPKRQRGHNMVGSSLWSSANIRHENDA